MADTISSTVRIFYTCYDREMTGRVWETHFRTLPKGIRAKIMRYRRWQDRQGRMLGYLLLQEGLQGWGHAAESLKDVSTDRFGRPYVSGDVDFNISHSAEWVVCALTCKGRIGIDIEKIKPIDLSDFRDYMSPVQWKKIKEAKNMYETFYDFWTVKESTLKADGRGLSMPLEQVESHGDKAVLEGKTWFLKKLNISNSSSCHLASTLESPLIEMKQAEFGG